jgi:hypothetical protein
MDHEDESITSRLNWLIASQSFLFAANATLFHNGGAQRVPGADVPLPVKLIPLLAIGAGELIYTAILAEVGAFVHNRRLFRAHPEDVQSRDPTFPHVQGFRPMAWLAVVDFPFFSRVCLLDGVARKLLFRVDVWATMHRPTPGTFYTVPPGDQLRPLFGVCPDGLPEAAKLFPRRPTRVRGFSDLREASLLQGPRSRSGSSVPRLVIQVGILLLCNLTVSSYDGLGVGRSANSGSANSLNPSGQNPIP